MTRPRKATIDYFPHDASHGKTLHILETRWGNDGYAFWFKLLEMLASSSYHYIDCRDDATWEFLLSKTRSNEVSGAEILNMLAKLGAISATLWNNKIIYCENFVSRITDAYRKRQDSLPTIDIVIGLTNTVSDGTNINPTGFPAEETPIEGGNPAEVVPKGKGKGKEKEKRKKESLPEFLSQEDWDSFVAHRRAIKKPMTDNAEKRMLNQIIKFHEAGQDISAMIDTAIRKGWQDLYVERQPSFGGKITNYKPSLGDLI